MGQATGTPDPALVERGHYLAIAGDCVACHTAPGGKAFAGGLPLATPIGDVIATNITPSKSTGIGNYTLAQFSDAVRKGVRADGARLYPAMPYTAYAKVGDDDVAALYAYFMHGVAPVDATPPATRLPFPFDIRLSMAAWNLLFLDSKPFVADPGKSAQWNRGAYLVRGLAHCGVCHTPRNVLMAEDASRELGGGDVGPWHAPNITADATSGVGGWSDDELVAYMRTGNAANKAHAAGPMAEAVDNSLQHLSTEDLQAIAVFLKSVPGQRNALDARAPFAWGEASNDLPSIRGVALPANPDDMTGPQLYDAWCATCHQASGQGSFDGGLPPLFHSSTVGRANTNDLVMVILGGVHRQAGVPMPGFAHDLSDVQVATLGRFLTQRYGNPQATVTAEQVHALRGGASSSALVVAVQLAMAAAGVVLIILIVAYLRRRGRASKAARG